MNLDKEELKDEVIVAKFENTTEYGAIYRKTQSWIIFLIWNILITKNVFAHKKSKNTIDYFIFLHYDNNRKCV